MAFSAGVPCCTSTLLARYATHVGFDCHRIFFIFQQVLFTCIWIILFVLKLFYQLFLFFFSKISFWALNGWMENFKFKLRTIGMPRSLRFQLKTISLPLISCLRVTTFNELQIAFSLIPCAPCTSPLYFFIPTDLTHNQCCILWARCILSIGIVRLTCW